MWFKFIRIGKEKLLELELQKKRVELDLQQLQAKLDIEISKQKNAFEIQKQKIEIEKTETISLLKLDNQQQVAKIKLEAEKALAAEQMKNVKALEELKSTLAKEYYDKSAETMKDITLKGTEQGKFVQELSLKMMDKALEKPMPAHMISEKIVSKTVKTGGE